MYTMETFNNVTEFVDRTEGELATLLLKSVKAHQDVSESVTTYISQGGLLLYTVYRFSVEPWQSPVVGEEETRYYVMVENVLTGEKTQFKS